jgi:DNA methyltransferase 1-associated protein 1
MEYSQYEYDLHLADPNWTAHETAYLFDMLRVYDLRFIVVADRYEYSGSQPLGLARTRSVEVSSYRWLEAYTKDIKDRYYTVCRRLIRTRAAGDPTAQQQQAQLHAFDKGESCLGSRSLTMRSRNQTQTIRIRAVPSHCGRDCRGGGPLCGDQTTGTGRETLWCRSRSLDAYHHGLGQWTGRPGSREYRSHPWSGQGMLCISRLFSGVADVRRARNARGPTRRHRRAPLRQSPRSKRRMRHLVRRALAIECLTKDAAHCIFRVQPLVINANTSHLAAKHPPHVPAFARSIKMPVPPQTAAIRISSLMTELGVATQRLVMPTRLNLDAYDSLLVAVGALVDIKRQVDRVEQECRTLQAQRKAFVAPLQSSVGRSFTSCTVSLKFQGRSSSVASVATESERRATANE